MRIKNWISLTTKKNVERRNRNNTSAKKKTSISMSRKMWFSSIFAYYFNFQFDTISLCSRTAFISTSFILWLKITTALHVDIFIKWNATKLNDFYGGSMRSQQWLKHVIFVLLLPMFTAISIIISITKDYVDFHRIMVICICSVCIFCSSLFRLPNNENEYSSIMFGMHK